MALTMTFAPPVIGAGTGSPEGVVTGSPGDIWRRTNGAAGTTFYVKETGAATNTGWVAYGPSSGTASFPVLHATGGDDSSAFASAITALPATGGTILLPDALYKIGTVTLPASPKVVTLIGAGINATTIKQFNASIGSAIVSQFEVPSGATFRARDLTIDGTTTLTTTGLMRLVHGAGSGPGGVIDLERVKLTKYSYGVWSEDEEVRLQACILDGGDGGNGMGVPACTGIQHAYTGVGRCWIDACLFTDNGATGTNQHHGTYFSNGIEVMCSRTRFTRLWGTGFQVQHNGGSQPGREAKYTDCYLGVGAATNAATGMCLAANQIVTCKNVTWEPPDFAVYLQQNSKLNLLGCILNGAAAAGNINYADTGAEVFADDCTFNTTAANYQFYLYNNSSKLTVQNSRFTGACQYDVNVLTGLTGVSVVMDSNEHTGATAGAARFTSGDRATIKGSRFYGAYSDAAIRNNTASNLASLAILSNDFSQSSGSSVVLTVTPTTLFDDGANYGSTGYRTQLPGVATITYSASMTPDAKAGKIQRVTVTNGTAYTFNAPTNPFIGAELVLDILNSSGGASGAITFNAVYKQGGLGAPANTKRRTISFYYDGTNWVETGVLNADL